MLAATVLGLSILSGLVDVLATAYGRTVGAWGLRREDGATARSRVFGPYAAGIDAIRRRLPPSASYVLVETGEAQGAAGVVAYDLAPRRGLVPARGAETVAGLKRLGPSGGACAWVVVARSERLAPLLLTHDEFFGR